ncbi:hypothetical protein OG233_30600 [Streptomyces sp. NBC_01218]|uniref:hypothetical protein n=1 Tax=Streptomyces sp. NBC_01218 TaxID=2903780 RepID=UPI002E12F087|nr:hypothetical protein OG233_00050 [Streptomyces sp. NBC_01218]WSQ55151.1 hypothetical protein OG233_30600 [Streptomyces sp. NBC_01218]
MSPSQERMPRRRYAAAALVANSLGAAAGFVTQSLVSDPTTSVLVGTVVSGAVGDVLLQVTRQRGDQVQPDPEQHRPGDLSLPAHCGTGTGRRHPIPARAGYTRCSELSGQHQRTATPQPFPRPGGGAPQHPRHRHLHRAAQRRVEANRTAHAQIRSGHGAA